MTTVARFPDNNYGGRATAPDRDVETRAPQPPSMLEQCRTVHARLTELGSMSRHLIEVLLGARPADPRFESPKKSTPPDQSTVSGFLHAIGDSLAEAEMNLGLVLQEIGK